MLKSTTFAIAVVLLALCGPLTAYFHSSYANTSASFDILAAGRASAQEQGSNTDPSANSGTSPYGNRDADRGGTYTPPTVYVSGGNVPQTASQDPIDGSITLFNAEDSVVGGITYRLDLISPLSYSDEDSQQQAVIEDAYEIYDQQLREEPITLLPGEETVVPFTFTPPQLPSGNYRLRAQIVMDDGRELGWEDFTLYLDQANEASFARIIPGAILHPEFPDEVIPPLNGPNVKPGGTLTLTATVGDPTTESLQVTPTLTVAEFNNPASPQIISFDSLTLSPTSPQEIDLPITVPTTPGIYEGSLALITSNQVQASNIVKYRWVVIGNDAAIVAAKLQKVALKAEERLELEIDITGPGDAESSVAGTLTIEVTDNDGVIGKTTVSNLSLDDAIESGLARVTLTRDVTSGPITANLTLTNEAGDTLDNFSVTYELSDEELQSLANQQAEAATESGTGNNRLLATALIILLVTVAALLSSIAWWKKRRASTRPPTGGGTINAPSAPPNPPRSTTTATVLLVVGVATITALLLVPGTTFLTASTPAGGGSQGFNVVHPKAPCQQHQDWCSLGRYVVEIFVNQPFQNHPTKLNSKRVPLKYRVRWAVCANRVAFSRTIVKYLPEGGKHNQWRPPRGQTWNFAHYETRATSNCGAYRCFKVADYVAPNGINLSNIDKNATNTTLQFQVLWRWDGYPPGWAENNYHYDLYAPGSRLQGGFYAGWVHARNVWINLQPATQCSDGEDNDGDGRKDQNDPGCHTDFDRSNASSYNPNRNSETDRQCSDGKDNDGDGTIDSQDVGCRAGGVYNPADNSEGGAACSDGIDNDDDGRTDNRDPACHTDFNASNAASYNPNRTTEHDPQCSDGIDNDNNGRKDQNDPGCHSDGNVNNPASYQPQDNRERGAQCADARDNDIDGRKDQNDPACHTDYDASNPASYNPNRNSEIDRQCSDLKDNDNDGLIDLKDTNCNGPADNLERGLQCSDNKDNDGDGRIDEDDPGCHMDRDVNNPASYNPNRNSEIDRQCSDGKDNDGDGRIDRADIGCWPNGVYNPSDNSEGGSACSDGVDNDGDGLIDIHDPTCHTDGNAHNPNTYNPNRPSEQEGDPDLNPTPVPTTTPTPERSPSPSSSPSSRPSPNPSPNFSPGPVIETEDFPTF